MDGRPPNRLANEASPYLRQHATNPVDWFPWGDEAFELARAKDRPIFLSVGYAACHWCHVMERESFEDAEIARLLNERFVSIKVDREERPDVDGVYMDAVQALTGQGGWPMSVWLSPDGEPFYAGTYFPDEPRHGMPSFRQVLEGLAEAWATRRDQIDVQAARVTEAIGAVARLTGSREPLTDEIEHVAFAALRRAFDERWGGFGGAPKFPQPMVLEFMLRMALRGTPDAFPIVELTLERMAEGGMHDQVGGGFSRYSTDERWHVPHFEKMLYDNAQLAAVYTHAWLATRAERYRTVARSTLDYLLRELRQPGGGFSSSQDADSEGEEGRFFTWTWDELTSVVSEPVAAAFGATPSGNWEGTNVLWFPRSIEAVATEHRIDPDQLAAEVEDARALVFDRRERRRRPAIDDKVVTAWNALAIVAFAHAGRAFEEPSYIEAADSCGAFVWERLRRADGRLLRSWRDDIQGPEAFADDHALLAHAFLALYETTGELEWFVRARALADALVELFGDVDRGGFFQSGNDAPQLVVRPKDLYDNASPSGNSAAADVLQRLALLTGDVDLERAGVSALRLVREPMMRAPTGFGHALCALDLYVGPTREVAIVGDPAGSDTRALMAAIARDRFSPNVVIATSPPGDEEAPRTVALLEGRPQLDGRATAYVCERFSCRLPVSTPEQLTAQLDAR
jgi:hypothetical protein